MNYVSDCGIYRADATLLKSDGPPRPNHCR